LGVVVVVVVRVRVVVGVVAAAGRAEARVVRVGVVLLDERGLLVGVCFVCFGLFVRLFVV
jgi:hypothetical protein